MTMSTPVAIPIPTDKVRRHDITDVLRTLLYLIESPSSAVEFERSIRIHSDLPSSDPDVKRFFTSLNAVWPFWEHYLEPTSLQYVTEAICGSCKDTVERFQAECKEAVTEFQRMNGAGDLSSAAGECAAA